VWSRKIAVETKEMTASGPIRPPAVNLWQMGLV
jgi:hypothetical protein